MKKYLLFIFFAFFIISCKKQSATNYIFETETAEALTNTSIDSFRIDGRTVYDVVPGTKTVFKYDHTWENRDPAIADGYSHTTYAFAIDLLPSQTSFLLVDDQIRQATGYYSNFAIYGPPRTAVITKGRILGTKINNITWRVEMHFELANSTIDLTMNFTIK